ncbi:MAG: hypothetical protein CME67_08060 [Halobacteriovoraceae bacterium]|nr:hypothetical protein [Halobacteriovoraceae bacterium]|tara:strand:- start:802 stop:1059 length:258 start_codon:yes stop_codon:yes gene_type:complete
MSTYDVDSVELFVGDKVKTIEEYEEIVKGFKIIIPEGREFVIRELVSDSFAIVEKFTLKGDKDYFITFSDQMIRTSKVQKIDYFK